METLDLGPLPLRPGPRRLLGVAVVSVVAVLIAGSLAYGLTDPDFITPPEPTNSSKPRPATRTRGLTRAPPPVRHWKIDGFLADTDLDLFARSDTRLYRIQTKRQVVTATDLATLDYGGSLTFIADHDQVLIRNWARPADGLRVIDGHAAQPLPDALRGPDQILPGPAGRLWVTRDRGEGPVTELTDLNGKPVAATHGVSKYHHNGLQSDGHRGLILTNARGTYDLRPDGAHRLTRGAVVATSASHVLATDCDRRLRCSRYLIDRDTGQSRRVGPVPATGTGTGTVSSNGRYAALWIWTHDGTSQLRIIDLRQDTPLATLDGHQQQSDTRSLIWLPDHRLLAVLDQKLILFDPATKRTTIPDLQLKALQQLILRDDN